MALLLTLADISPLPFLIAEGVMLAGICGVFLALAVLVAGIIKRTRNRNKSNGIKDKR